MRQWMLGTWKLGRCEVGPSLVQIRVCPFANSSSPPQSSSSSLVSSWSSSPSSASIIHHPPSLSSFVLNHAERQCEYENTHVSCGVRTYAELLPVSLARALGGGELDIPMKTPTVGLEPTTTKLGDNATQLCVDGTRNNTDLACLFDEVSSTLGRTELLEMYHLATQ